MAIYSISTVSGGVVDVSFRTSLKRVRMPAASVHSVMDDSVDISGDDDDDDDENIFPVRANIFGTGPEDH